MVYFLKIFFSLNIMKLFNILKFKLIVFNEKENLIDYKKFFFPLDNILNWNLITPIILNPIIGILLLVI